MSTRNSDSLFDDGPRDDREANPLRRLKGWQRIAICVAFFALMVDYLRWLTAG